MKVYHGSPSKFTIFKHSKINAHGNMHGRGFYFTDYKSLAEGYQKDGGQLLEGYLIIEKAVLTVDNVPTDHKKFSAFSYYSVDVLFDGNNLPIKINVGKSKTAGDYHIYDLTPDKNRRAAHEASPHVARVTGTGALKNSSSEDSISHSPEKSNISEENSPKPSLGPDSVPVEERGTPKKTAEEYVETEFKASPEEVKAATKAVKQFKLLDAETREAIINMIQSVLVYRRQQKNPHCLVCTVVQNTEQAEGHIFQDIENVTINHGLPDNKKVDMPAPIDSDIYRISKLYRFVKTLLRKDGGIKYSQEDRTKYAFTYSAHHDGTKYSLSLDGVAVTKEEVQRAVDTVKAKNEAAKETPPRPRAYYKNQVKMATEESPNKIDKSLSYLSKRPCKTGITVLY